MDDCKYVTLRLISGVLSLAEATTTELLLARSGSAESGVRLRPATSVMTLAFQERHRNLYSLKSCLCRQRISMSNRVSSHQLPFLACSCLKHTGKMRNIDLACFCENRSERSPTSDSILARGSTSHQGETFAHGHPIHSHLIHIQFLTYSASVGNLADFR